MNVSFSFKVIWMNPRKTLISTDDSRYIDDSRLSVERPKIEDWNLMIREVRYNDSGEYMCQVNTKPVMIKRIYLFVKGQIFFMIFRLCLGSCVPYADPESFVRVGPILTMFFFS